jgi:L-asparaginase
MPERKKLLFVHTGGTLGMLPSGDPGPLAPSHIAEDLLPYVRGLEDHVEIDAEVVCNLDSTDLTPHHWELFGQCITDRRDDYDGFVILHGTDTMAYTASALSFMLWNLDKPVVLTGSQRPVAEVRTDGRTNLISSAICATLDIPEVGIYFGQVLMRGNRATKRSIQSYAAFDSPNLTPLVVMGVDIQLGTPPRRPTGPFQFQPGFNDRVAILSLFPGCRPSWLRAAVGSGAKGVLLLGFGSGNVPLKGWPEAIAEATAAGVAVVLGTQCHKGRVTLRAYDNGAAAEAAGALSAGPMTTESAVVKTMYLLARTRDRQDFGEAWPLDLAGELEI